MTHDPLCDWWTDQCQIDCPAFHGCDDSCSHEFCSCDLITKVRADTLDKAIASIQPIWERGKALGDPVFADGWLTCFECCESALETMRDKP